MIINVKKIKELLEKSIKFKTKEGTIHKKNISKTDAILNDLETNHNHSWYQELWNRNKNSLDDIALLYRGNQITYREMFSKMEQYAKSLKEMGIGIDSEIPVCMSNCPEIVYLMGAASMIGAKLNIFGPQFPNDYIKEIINSCNSEVIFLEDNAYCQIKDALENTKIKTIVMNSLRDSLKNNHNPYEFLDKKNHLFINKTDHLKEQDKRIILQKDFLEIGENYQGKINAKTKMDQDFLITYTSGSTNELRPKAIVHSSRNFITIARYHDKDINGITTKNFTSLAHIPTFSNTNLVSCISDSLMQGAKLALEPCYDKDFFIESILIYQPHYVAATKSFWINLAKQIQNNPRYQNATFDNLLMAFVCGEPFELNEETFINKALIKAKAGIKVTHTPNSIVRVCEAAGDCEHGSIFYTLFRSYFNNLPSNKKQKDAAGLTHFPFVEVAVLDEKGNHLESGKLGRIVANSPCTMKKYRNNEEATKRFFRQDSTGKTWADMNLYGYMDKKGKVYIRGRIPEEKEILPPFMLAKRILEDRKNILSCEVVYDKETNNYIAHIELQPNHKNDLEKIISLADLRTKPMLDNINRDIFYRIHSFEESYPLTKSGKRDVKRLQAEGLTPKCIRPYYINGDIYLKQYEKEKQKIKKKS